jgi:hypothetical protein
MLRVEVKEISISRICLESIRKIVEETQWKEASTNVNNSLKGKERESNSKARIIEIIEMYRVMRFFLTRSSCVAHIE